MANRATITYNNRTISTEDRDGNFAITYNGSTIATVGAGQTKTLNCSNKVMKTNVVVGGKTLNCAKYKMATNVVISVASLFPSQPTSYSLIGTYSSSQTWTAPEDGYFQIEVFGASGNGGKGVAYYYPIGPISSAASGGGGGGGGKAISRVKLNTGDTIVLTLNGVGTDTTAAINSSIETYNTITVTSGGNGGNVSISGTSLSQAAGGAGGNASGGNYSNANGSSGGDGELKASGASSAPAKGIGGSIYTTGGDGGTGYLTTGSYLGGSWGNYEGESGVAGYIKIYRGNTNLG